MSTPWFTKIPLVLFLFCCSVTSFAQAPSSQTRDAEWKSYSLPQTNFSRQVDTGKNFMFRIPADWQQQGSELVFSGPHSSKIRVVVQKVPDGYPLQEYFGSIVKTVRDSATPVETTLTRKTQLQDLEARELLVEVTTAEGESIRSTSWITVNGPLALMFNFQAPLANAAETEPFFKAVVQSVIFLADDYPAFENLRSSTLKSPAPGPIHEIESIIASLNEVNTDRESVITRLSSLFSSLPDVAVDLLLDRRPFVRAAAVQGLAQANNTALTPFLWEMIDDDELIVAEAAAHTVANTPDVVATVLKKSLFGYQTKTIARVWPFLTKDKRNELLQRIFSDTAVRRPTAPSLTAPPVRRGVTTKPAMSEMTIANDPNIQIGALTLLSTITPEEFKLPLARIMASNYDPLIAVGLQVANDRSESLSLDALFKLVASSDHQVSKLAAQSFVLSASVADIPRIEALISKDSAKKELDDELKLAIKKIRFRQELSLAKSANKSREIIGKASTDSSLDEFAWRFDCEATVAGCASVQTPLRSDFSLKPFAENLFPKKILYYTLIPNPGQAVQKFYETLHGLQMDSPRAQSNLVLMMGSVRQNLAQQMSAPVDAGTLIEYTGIDPNSPIALGAWTPEGACDSTSSAKRRAIVLRVKDRARFERAIEQLQQASGNFVDLTDYLAGGTRLIAALPAFLPLTAQAILSTEKSKTSHGPLLNYNFVADRNWNGLHIKTIEHRWIDSSWQIQSGATHMLFIGDNVILAPDLATIRDLLSKVNQTNPQHLADNREFQKTVERRGDILYLSDLNAVMAENAAPGKDSNYKIDESGSLNIAASSWENSDQLVFKESEWAKPFLPFHPKELSAPHDLLPASTIAYYLMKVDLASLWAGEWKTFVPPEDLQTISNFWAIDFKQEVLPELGPECGMAALELPGLEVERVTWAAFCKLKSNKLADALTAGKLLNGVGPTKDFAEIKRISGSYFIAARNGFLVVSNQEKGLAALDGKSSLASTRDYLRSAEKVPGGIVAFGGYNLEASVAAASKKLGEGKEALIASMIFSVASAFHSQNFYATATSGTVEVRSSVAMDREGRYPVADVSYLPRGTNITLAMVEPTGIPITDQNRLSSLVLKLRAKAPGPIDNIKDDIKTAEQAIEQKSPKELLVTVAARKAGDEKAVELPVKNPAFEPFLKETAEFSAGNPQVKDQARQIAGNDRDAWSVARKLADWTHKNLEWKHVVSADAAQTLATREADCSEFSQLFVAMARSLGLPSRLVSGLAYSGNSFGGHAWVEVWAGRWIELDPTWGTHYVDATHIRNSPSNTLVMSAALNLIELEVVEARRTVADFQKSPAALTQHLLKVIPAGDRSEIEAAIDLPTLTDEFMGADAWSKMNDRERDQMSSAYSRLLKEIIDAYSKSTSAFQKLRLLHLEEKGKVAEATCLLAPADVLLKLRLVRRNDLWYLVEVVQSDTNVYSASELLRPAIAMIESVRAGQKVVPASMTDFARALRLIDSDAAKAVAAADSGLKINPADQGLRLVKALALLRIKEKVDEGMKLLRELSNENFAPGVYRLAINLNVSEDKQQKEEIVRLYERYTSLEPYDSRGFNNLAFAYDDANRPIEAEAAYRKAIELNPGDSDLYLDLMFFLIVNDRLADVTPVLAAADKHNDTKEDLFGSMMKRLFFTDHNKNAESFAASQPLRLKGSAVGNLILGRINLDDGRYAVALRLLDTSTQLDPKSADPYIVMATVYRKQFRWTAALKAADQAVKLSSEDGEAHYERACALARLGRIKEAMSALEEAIELDPEQTEWMADEKDLKALASLPAFKKLLPHPKKP